jgi:hypothetical protein
MSATGESKLLGQWSVMQYKVMRNISYEEMDEKYAMDSGLKEDQIDMKGK